jgi:hypothetical protein
MERDDNTLWSRVRSGDAEAFGILFDRHADAIYNFCFRRIGDWASAEDLVSIVFWRPGGAEMSTCFLTRFCPGSTGSRATSS